MKVPATDIHFHEDVRLLVWRPRGVIDEAAVKHVLTLIEDLEARAKEPFDRFTDTSAPNPTISPSNIFFMPLSFGVCLMLAVHR